MSSVVAETAELGQIASGLEAIIDAAADVLGASSLAHALRRMADALMTIVPYTSLAVYELDEAAAQLVPMIAVGSYVDETLADRPPLDGSLTGRAVRARAVVSIGPGDAAEELTIPGTPADECEALVVCPLLVGDRPIGTLNVWRESQDPTFLATEERLLQRFATLAAMAYVNARQADVLREQARRDPLTGVFNRRHFERQLEEALEHPSVGGAVILLDVDEFKPINDRYGHPAGDRVLKALAAALEECAAGRGSVYRVGGDEFAVLLPGMRRDAVADWVTGACAAITRITPGVDCAIRASAGYALIAPEDDLESITRRADDELLQLKRRR